MKRLLCFILTLMLLCLFTAPLVAVADEKLIENNLIELSNDEYRDYINSLLRPSFFGEFFNEMVASAEVSLIKEKDYESTNAPKPSGIGSIGSSIGSAIIDYGIEIIRDIINNSDLSNTNKDGFQIPEFKQQMGKLRNVYNSGMIEIITCYLTTWQTPVIGVLDEPTGQYENHCILSFVRQMDDYYTITTLCSSGATEYCETYTNTGNLKSYSYSPFVIKNYIRFFDAEEQETIPNHAIPATCSSYSVNFYDIAVSDEFTFSTFDANILFGTYAKQGLPEFSSGNSYRTLYHILLQYNVFPSDSAGARGIAGAVFAVTNTITNDYQDYSQQKQTNDESEQKQSITYLQDINTTNVINKTNINDYDFLTIEGDKITTNNNFNSWWRSDVSETIQYNVTNNYANYWYIGDPDPTELPSTIPTQSPTEPSATIPTQPPVIVPTTDYVLEIESYDVNYPIVVDEPYGELQKLAHLPTGIAKDISIFFEIFFEYVPSDVIGVLTFILLLSIVTWFLFR